MNTKTQRINGFDFARALAIIGMVLVNFKVVMVKPESEGSLYAILEMLSGKAAALFVVLAGVGMSLMYQSAVRKNDPDKIKQVKVALLKRSLFLLVVGLSYYFIWPADILHYYAFYMALGILFLAASKRWLLWASALLPLIFIGLCFLVDYDTGWNWETLHYSGFFTPKGFIRNLFFNGFHPVIPWLAFLLTGIWVGRINFSDNATTKRTLAGSLIVFGTFQVLSIVVSQLTASIPNLAKDEVHFLFSTQPMPPGPFYMVCGSSLAVAIISISVLIARRFEHTLLIRQMLHAGQMALTLYFAHVVIGMLGIAVVTGKLEQAFSVEFVTAYALSFCAASVVLAHLWRKRFERGPLELLMRKLTS